jgi:hypothetical protein
VKGDVFTADVAIIFSEEPSDESGVAYIKGEYETFWSEKEHICWKLYTDRGVVIIRMRLEIFMESMLGDENVMGRLFQVATKE